MRENVVNLTGQSDRFLFCPASSVRSENSKACFTSDICPYTVLLIHSRFAEAQVTRSAKWRIHFHQRFILCKLVFTRIFSLSRFRFLIFSH